MEDNNRTRNEPSDSLRADVLEDRRTWFDEHARDIERAETYTTPVQRDEEMDDHLPRAFASVGEGKLQQAFTPRIEVAECVHSCDCGGEHPGGGGDLPVPMYHVAQTAVDATGNFYYKPDGIDAVLRVDPSGNQSETPLAAGALSAAAILANPLLGLNLIYFPRAYCFHPGAVAERPANRLNPAPPHSVVGGSGPFRKVMTVDSGVVEGNPGAQTSVLDFIGGSPDSWATDVITGHGPAVADVIGGVVGRDNSMLTRIDYNAGAVGVGYVVDVNGELVRGFDADSLYRTLRNLWDPFGKAERPDFQVLNLSLGTVACSDAMSVDPVGSWIKGWLGADRGRPTDTHRRVASVLTRARPTAAMLAEMTDMTESAAESAVESIRELAVSPDQVRQLMHKPSRSAVVAAGNHGNCVRSWPAAYTEQWGMHRNLYAVGSGTAAQPDSFSARGEWVNAWATGTNVSVEHPTLKPAVWTGTSFAAPQIAAKAAAGQRKSDIVS